jgi:hypothetical protein
MSNISYALVIVATFVALESLKSEKMNAQYMILYGLLCKTQKGNIGSTKCKTWIITFF